MKRISRITCLMLSALMIVMSSAAVFATDSEGNSLSAELATAERVSGMVSVSAPYPFEFVVSTTNENTAFISFVPDTDTEYTFYLGVKGERQEIFKINRTQYMVEVGVEYSFAYSYAVGDDMIVYNGTLLVTADDAGITATPTGVVKNVTYAGDITEAVKTTYFAANSRAAGTVNESESNNTMATADRTYDDYDSFGTLGSSSDVDWWKVSFTMSGTANFWLGSIPSGCNYDISVYSQAGMLLGESNNLNQASELVQIDVTAGTYYYIKVDSAASSSSSQYLLRVKNYRNIASDEFGFYVYDADTLEPISGASVYAYRPKTYLGSYPVPTAQITNSSGEVYFSKTSLPFYDSSYTGGYGIIIKAPGYAQYTSPQYVFSGTERQNIALVSKNSYPDFYSPFEPNETCTTPSMSDNQHWGWRYLDNIDYHTGVDIGKAPGTKLYTVTNSGKVKLSANTTGAGNYVIIQSGSYYIAYLHMDTVVVSTDQIFTDRTQVGTVGNTGTKDYHLHISIGLEQTIQTSARSYLDPLAFLPFE